MTKLKLKIRDWLFPDYRLEVDLAIRANKSSQERHEKEIKRLSQYSIVDCVREQLKGFNPKLLDESLYDSVDTAPDVLEQYDSEDSEEVFLSKIRDLYNNPTFNAVLNYLVRNQLIYTAKEARDFNEISFGRATINGLILFKDEVERLKAIYDERHIHEESFDRHEVT